MKRYWKLTAIFLIISILLQTAARTIPGMGNWYASHIYPIFVNTIGRAAGIFPFSVSELGIYLLIIFCIIHGSRHIRHPLLLLSQTAVLASGLFLVYTLNCGINYYRLPFSAYLEYKIEDSSVEELKELCQYMTEQVNVLAPQRDYTRMDKQAGRLGDEAMAGLGAEYPELSGFYPRPKGLTIPYVLSVQQLAGIYLPFTIEANYNSEMPAYNIPHTICHELSHLKGFMREDEANFIGYLACINSDSVEFKYSGYLLGWIYAGNSLAEVDMESYSELYSQLNEITIRELNENSLFWDKYEGKIAEAANQINDTYLKMNSQEDGVRSYGRVTDLLLAYYRNREK